MGRKGKWIIFGELESEKEEECEEGVWKQELQFPLLDAVYEKSISQSKKELKNFIWAKFEDYNPGRVS